MPEQEGTDPIPPTENLQRIERREGCACGDVISLPADATRKMIATAVIRHQRTVKHRVWWDHLERTGSDW